ncbi:MAG: isoprenylcysteine carboxylmethyltransferase family protein [Rhizomicrobium sp.]|jgi:protein-S-isoprenylcysteine O-methyltransferase Ste14
MQPMVVIFVVWAGWLVSWWTAAVWTHPTLKRAGLLSEFVCRALAVIGFCLLFGFASGRYDMIYRFWRTPNNWFGWVLVFLTVVGFTFCWWARIHLGRLWSSRVTRKHEHHIVDTGPYALVRHPIYAGITLASLATAIAWGTPSAFLGATLMTLGWYIKARIEERFLREELGPQAYDSYARRVPMLVPFVHWPI